MEFLPIDNKILLALMGNEPELCATLTPDSLLVQAETRTISILSDLYDKEIISTIGWAKQVPGKKLLLCGHEFDLNL